MAVVEGTRRRDVGAATQDLYRQYGKQIYAYCYHRLRSREEAEDAVQTTFMNAFRALQRGAETHFEQAWLFKIAQNVCIARSSSSARRLRLEAPNDFEVLQEIVPAQDGERPIDLIGVEEALEAMPDNQRRAILLREWQGLSYREISTELGLSQAAVEMLIFRARRALAGALEQPDTKRQKKLSRKVGSAGSLLGALKTLLGGGTAIKAVAVAAAGAIAVVGESAQHTIVRHIDGAAHRSSTAATTHSSVAVAASHAAGSRPEPSRTVSPVRRTRVHARTPRPAEQVSAPSPSTDVGSDVGAVTAPAAPATPAATTTTAAPPASTPAPAPAPAPAAAPAPAPQPTVTTTAAAPQAAPQQPPTTDDTKSAPPPPPATTTTTTVTTVSVPAPPQSPFDGSHLGGDHTRPVDDPAQTTTTTTTATTQTQTVTTVTATPPLAPTAP